MRAESENELGIRIREARKSMGLTQKQLADMVGVSYLTIYRVETGRVSPSVSLLSDIADCLRKSVTSFLRQEQGRLTLIREEEQAEIESDALKVRLLVPKGLISESISISLGKAKVGEFVGNHTNEGFELSYIIRGKCLFKHGANEYNMNPGDLVYFDGSVWHSVVALEPLEFLIIQFRDNE